METKITWSAKNNSSFLNGSRKSKSVRAAITAARRYVQDELYGEGVVTVFANGNPIREDEKSIFTNQKWVTKII